MNKDIRIKQLANQAAIKIKALTDAHQTQIEAIYQEFREQAANLESSNGDSLSGSTVTPVPSPANELKEPHDLTLRQ